MPAKTTLLPGARVARARGALPLSSAEDGVLALSVAAMVKGFLKQSPAFWFVCLYIFFEYVRPQQIYTWMDVAPWPLLSLMGAVICTVLEGRLAFTARRLWFFVGVFSLVIIASSATAQFPAVSWKNLNIWVNWLLLMIVVGAGVRTRIELALLLLTFGLWNLKMSQHGVQGWLLSGTSFRTSGVSGAPGWFQNSGEFGIQMCIFLPLVGYMAVGLWPRLSSRRRLFMVAVGASSIISMIASSSRGALIGAVAIGIWVLIRSRNRLKASVIVAVVAVGIYVALPAESKARFSEMGKDKDSISRLTYWRDGVAIANSHPVLGIGYKNWIPFYRQKYNVKGELPHNFLIECAAELGYLGVLALLALLGVYFLENAKTRRETGPKSANPDRFLWSIAHGLDGAMIGFMVSGSFVTVLFYPYIWMNVALALALATVASKRRLSARDTRRSLARNGSSWAVTAPTPGV